jgi:enoyl-CoA hydratase
MAEPALFEAGDGVAVFTLNRPRQRNAVDPALSAEMNRLVAAFERDPDLRIGILTGAGPAFCAGADLKAVAAGRLRELVEVEPHGFAGLLGGGRSKPMIAAVNGPAVAAGFEIALACDLLLGSREASFGLPEVRHGRIAAATGLQRLPRLVAPQLATEMILTGRSITAEEAFAAGLLVDLTEPEDLLPRARRLAAAIAGAAPLAVRESLAVLRVAIAGSPVAAEDAAAAALARVNASADAHEGAVAFAAGRLPVWRGS